MNYEYSELLHSQPLLTARNHLLHPQNPLIISNCWPLFHRHYQYLDPNPWTTAMVWGCGGWPCGSGGGSPGADLRLPFLGITNVRRLIIPCFMFFLYYLLLTYFNAIITIFLISFYCKTWPRCMLCYLTGTGFVLRVTDLSGNAAVWRYNAFCQRLEGSFLAGVFFVLWASRYYLIDCLIGCWWRLRVTIMTVQNGVSWCL